MNFYDAIIIGGGPAGLTAALYLGQANYGTLILDKEGPGGYMQNIEFIENYPGFSEGISGASLASAMAQQATKYGVEIKLAEVDSIDLYTSTRCVNCVGDERYTASVIIIAGGSRHKKLGVPGEDGLEGKGVFSCALCDGGQFTNKVVAVCGGGDSGMTEALYMAKLASKVYILEAMPKLSAKALLQDRAKANPKIDIRCGTTIKSIAGKSRVEALECVEIATGKEYSLPVDGVLVSIGLTPNTDYLEGIVPLDSGGQIIVNQNMETETPYVLAAGDIRSGSIRQIAAAVGDGAVAAVTAQKILQEME
ncbi:MAG: FAD-dependent oxidoreductase [Deltaproteobacteria bacterium]|nr:FAD-dependent oxidoreductase [Deltaproteobacteria bacterium]